MRGSGLIIGAALSAVAVSAAIAEGKSAQFQPSAVTARVDESGRVTPLPAAGVDGGGLTGAAASPCPDAVALPIEAARALVKKIAAEERFFPDFVLSVAKIESAYASTALSDKGAYGLMQLMPTTAQRFKVHLCDPVDNVRGGVRYLRFLHDRYRNPFFILAAYNAGEDAVDRMRGVPPYSETVRFVAAVINDFYVWPLPSSGGPEVPVAPAATANTTLPGVADDRSADSAGSRPAPQAVGQWSGGFVMHVQ